MVATTIPRNRNNIARKMCCANRLIRRKGGSVDGISGAYTKKILQQILKIYPQGSTPFVNK
jgi:hypothetical protein